MKTKFLLGALALPMFFAACTNEELVEAPVTANLQNRIPLGEVTLDFGGIESRLALKDGNFNAFAWTNGDDLGASLIDVRNNATYDADEDINKSVMYNLTSTPQTNYRYEYQNGAWTSPAAMVEGNYVFYMPYVENTQRVAPLAVLPVEQNLEQVEIEGETAYTTYNDVLSNAKENGHIMAVAYKFLSAEGENNDGNKTISVSFKQLYATPLISIQNYARDAENELTDLTIKKIVLSKSDESPFTVKERLNFTSAEGNTALYEAHNNTDGSIVACLNTVLNPEDEDYFGGTWAVGDNTYPKATADLLTGTYEEEDGSHESETITINVEDPITIASEETFSFYAVIPAGDYETSKLVVTLVTNDDEQVSVTLPGVDVNPGKRYAVSGYDAEGNVDAGAAAMLAVTTEQLVPAEVKGVEIATQAELYSAIAKATMVDTNSDGIADAKTTLKFVPAEGIVLNNQVINMLNDKTDEVAGIEFYGDMTISGLTSTTTIPVMIDGKATISGTVEVAVTTTEGGAANKVNITGAVTVAEGAKVGLSGDLVKGLTNNGELTITAATTALDNVTNNSILNLESTLTLTGKELKNAAGASINAIDAASVTAKKIANEGTINVVFDTENEIEGTLTITADEVENKGVVAAADMLTVTGKFTNKENAELNINGGTASVSAKFVNEGTVAIAEGAILNASFDTSINKNEINNAGTLTIDLNSGTINVTNSSKFGTSTTTVEQACDPVDGKEVWGNIYNPYGKTITDETLEGDSQQYVWNSEEAYTGEVNWVDYDGTFNAVKYDGATVAVKASNTSGLIYVEFNGNSKVSVATDKTLTLPTDVQINKELELVGSNVILNNAEITIAKDAVLGWNDDKVLSGNATLKGEGKVYANGNETGTFIIDDTDYDGTVSGL